MRVIGLFQNRLTPKFLIDTINRICKAFLWTGPDLANSKTVVSWASICYPYEEGGLNLRNVKVANHAANLRHIWNIVSKKDSLWTEWVCKNLIRGRNFWHLKRPSKVSWSWKGILKDRKHAQKLVRVLIGTGEEVDFWEDPRHPLGILKPHFDSSLTYDSLAPMHAKVSNFIHQREWHVPHRIELHLPEIVRLMKQIDIGKKDEAVWIPSVDGEYTLRDTYHAMRNKKHTQTWAKTI